MTNNKLCNWISGFGCGLCCFCMGLMIFGITGAVWGSVSGILITIFGLVNYD